MSECHSVLRCATGSAPAGGGHQECSVGQKPKIAVKQREKPGEPEALLQVD
jgi:hypothetical protein